MSSEIEFHQVHKSYGPVRALNGVSFTIQSGDFVMLAGHSGAGKTTLLRLTAAIERPTGGQIIIRGQNVAQLPSRGVPYLRRHLGLIFQDTKLLYDRSVFSNVMLPLVVTGASSADAARRARAALDKVGLLDRERVNPRALSGGEQQRLAIARAIVNRPAILIADEPTANLDREAAGNVVTIFREFNRVGVTVILATHDEALFMTHNPRVIRLAHGQLVSAATEAA